MWKHLGASIVSGLRALRQKFGRAVASDEPIQTEPSPSQVSSRTDFWKEFREGKREADARGETGRG